MAHVEKYDFQTDAVGQSLANPLRNYWYLLFLMESCVCRDLTLATAEEKSVVEKPLVHLLLPLREDRALGSPAAVLEALTLSWETGSPAGHRLVSARGRVGHHLVQMCRGGWVSLAEHICWQRAWARALPFLGKWSWVAPGWFLPPQPHRVFLPERGSPQGVCSTGSGANSSDTELVLMDILLHFWHHLLLSLIADARRD